MKKFYTGYMWVWSPEITEVEVVKETLKRATIIFNGKKITIASEGRLFSTFEDAKNAYILLAKTNIEKAKDQVSNAEEQLEELIKRLEK